MSKVIGYALALSCMRLTKEGTYITTITSAYTTRARSENEAAGIGLELAENKWPRKDGYYDHQVSVCEVTENDA